MLEQSRLKSLTAFLDKDPGNLSLIADAANAAFDVGELATAKSLIDRFQNLSPISPSLLNLTSLIAMKEGRFADAETVLNQLIPASPDDPALRFNLAWCRALANDWQGVAGLLDDHTSASSPRAATLRVQALHHLGDLEQAMAEGQIAARAWPEDQGLMGALATLAMDLEDSELAKQFAERATQNHEGLSALGMLSLADYETAKASTYFDQALQSYPNSARGMLGKGLSLVAEGDSQSASGYLDSAANAFRDHLGSWVAAGWAYFVQGDYKTSRERFETALAIDGTFSEVHGGLAVLDILAGDLEAAKKRTARALRLDPNCFSGALAKSMLLANDGRHADADQLRNKALNTPIGGDDLTIAKAVTRLSKRH